MELATRKILHVKHVFSSSPQRSFCCFIFTTGWSDGGFVIAGLSSTNINYNKCDNAIHDLPSDFTDGEDVWLELLRIFDLNCFEIVWLELLRNRFHWRRKRLTWIASNRSDSIECKNRFSASRPGLQPT